MNSRIFNNLIVPPLVIFALTYWAGYFFLGKSLPLAAFSGTFGLFCLYVMVEWMETLNQTWHGSLLFAGGLVAASFLITAAGMGVAGAAIAGTAGIGNHRFLVWNSVLLTVLTLVITLLYRYRKVGEGILAVSDGKLLLPGDRFRALPFIDGLPLMVPMKTESPMLLIVECADVKATARIETEIELHPERAAGRALDFAAIVTHARDVVTRRLARPTDEQLPGKPEHLTLGKFLKRFGAGGLGLSVDYSHPNDFPATCRIKGVSLVSVS